MSPWGEVFLGVIAVSTLVTAIMQVAFLVAAGRAARRLEQMIERIDQELKPALEHMNTIARDAARAVALATAQVERLDRLLTDLTAGVEQATGAVRNLFGGPLRSGGTWSAAASAAWAVWSAFRAPRRGRARSRSDEEDALFI